MQKAVLALSVAAALAVPTLAAAQAPAPAVPTLEKIFEASGLSEAQARAQGLQFRVNYKSAPGRRARLWIQSPG